MFAAQYGQAGVLDFFLSLGANIDMQNDKGDSALMLSVMGNYAQIVKLLLGRGASLTLRNSTGRTAM